MPTAKGPVLMQLPAGAPLPPILSGALFQIVEAKGAAACDTAGDAQRERERERERERVRERERGRGRERGREREQ